MNKNLVISGLNSNTTAAGAGHNIFRTKGCDGTTIAAVTKIGTFGDAIYVPMLHASTLDVKNQRLFLTVATGKSTMGIGMINLNDKEHGFVVLPENPAANQDIIGMQFDPTTNSVVSVMQNTNKGLDLHSLSIDAKNVATWKSTALPSFIGQLYGNSGSVSALDGANGMLYVLGGVGSNNDEPMHLIQIDLVKQIVIGSPLMNVPSDTLMEMNFA